MSKELRECAFCGSTATMTRIGNELHKKIQIRVKCDNPRCRTEQLNKALTARNGFEWLEGVALKAWNTRHGELEAENKRLEAAYKHAMVGLNGILIKCSLDDNGNMEEELIKHIAECETFKEGE